eukprot:CAMPEP_0119050090 /NCGR_PEP_ID=MMETSP1177-20130426/68129_1 /TAXON_ID=2985 /ORGANISM="Ochromonas sp, Strain CCMP1899" /LENGTH=771 /DNA_ID=CAMNT_0007028091 /DNA_START=405 /DNA_END=2720 /DNA_ORIENTATION=-
MVLTAAAMISPLPNILHRTFPYANLTDLSFLDVEGYIAGVTNPMFLERDSWWDLACVLDLPNGVGTVFSQDEKKRADEAYKGIDIRSVSSGNIFTNQFLSGLLNAGGRLMPSDNSEVVQQHLQDEADTRFISGILSVISTKSCGNGEEWLQQRFYEYTSSIIQQAHDLQPILGLDNGIRNPRRLIDPLSDRARKSVEAQAGRVLALRSSPDYLLIPNNPWMGVDIIEGRNQQIESSISQIISVANVSHLSTEMGDHIQGGTETVMSNTIESRGDEEGVKISMMTAFNAVDSTVTSDAYSVSIKSNATSVLLDTNEDVVLGITVQNEGKGVETKEEAKEGEKEMIEDVIKEEKKREKEGEKEEEIKEVIVEEKEKKDEEKEEEIEKKEEIEVQKEVEEEEEEEEKEGEPTVGTKVARASSISHDKVVTTKPSAEDLKIQKQIETLPAPPSSSVSAISKDTPDLSAPSSSTSAIPEENFDLSGVDWVETEGWEEVSSRLRCHVRRLHCANPATLHYQLEVPIIFGDLLRALTSESSVQALLTLMPQSLGGLDPIGMGLFHSNPSVRLSAMKLIETVTGYHSTSIAVTKMNGMLKIAYKRILAQFKSGVLERLIVDHEAVVRLSIENIDIEKISSKSSSSVNVKSMLDSKGIGVSSLKSIKEASMMYANSIKESLNKIDFSVILLKDEDMNVVNNLPDSSIIKTSEGFNTGDSIVNERLSSFATFSTDLFSNILFAGEQENVAEGLPRTSDVVADIIKPKGKGNDFYDLDSPHF